MDHHVATDGTSFIAQSMMLFGLTAQDVTIQAQVVNLMKDIQEELDMTDEEFEKWMKDAGKIQLICY